MGAQLLQTRWCLSQANYGVPSRVAESACRYRNGFCCEQMLIIMIIIVAVIQSVRLISSMV